MKKIICNAAIWAIAFIGMSTASVGAQDLNVNSGQATAKKSTFYRHNLSIGYGTLTLNDFSVFAANVIMPAATLGSVDPDNISIPGAINLSYGYNFSKRFSLGVLAGINFNSYDLTLSATKEKVGYNNHYFYLMPQATLRWVKTRDFSMYSSLAAGVDFEKESGEKSTKFAWQVCAVGMEYFIAHSKFGLFFDFGVGYAGLFQIGARTRF